MVNNIAKQETEFTLTQCMLFSNYNQSQDFTGPALSKGDHDIMLKTTGVAFDKKKYIQHKTLSYLPYSMVQLNQVIVNNFDWCAFSE